MKRGTKLQVAKSYVTWMAENIAGLYAKPSANDCNDDGELREMAFWIDAHLKGKPVIVTATGHAGMDASWQVALPIKGKPTLYILKRSLKKVK